MYKNLVFPRKCAKIIFNYTTHVKLNLTTAIREFCKLYIYLFMASRFFIL